jgi:hypothetical protein
MPTNSKKSSPWQTLKHRYHLFMNRRPHRSFRLTRRRDYVRPLELPGNIAFTHEVTQTVWRHKKTFLWLGFIYVMLFALLVGMQSQETYATLTGTLKSTSGDAFSGNWGAIGQAGLLLLTIASSGVNTEITEAQQIFSVLIFLLIWLTTVWLLRNKLAGHKVKLRDGLYNSGAPLFATVLITLFIAIQLIPVAVAFIGYSAASTSGLIAAGGAAAMLFWIGAGLLSLLSLYWITSSLFAMIIVTLPGMYPYTAIRTAGDMVLGRRIKILLRWLWMALMIILAWGVIMIPIILLDMGLKSLWPAVGWLPIVPITALIMAALTTIWMASYVYLLYRKVVEYAPAA